MGFIPSDENWAFQLSYLRKYNDIETMTIADIPISETDKDVIKLEGKSVDEVRKERLKTEKRTQIQKLNEEYGIKEDIKDKIENTILNPPQPDGKAQAQMPLWDMLQLKGIVKDGK